MTAATIGMALPAQLSSGVSYRLLADAVVLVHLAFVLFVVLGGLLVLRRPRLTWLHLPAALWGVWIELSGGVCPLTPLENHLRRRGGEAGYAGGFIDRYLVSLLYPDGLTPALQVALGITLLALTLAVYLRLLTRARRRSTSGR